MEARFARAQNSTGQSEEDEEKEPGEEDSKLIFIEEVPRKIRIIDWDAVRESASDRSIWKKMDWPTMVQDEAMLVQRAMKIRKISDWTRIVRRKMCVASRVRQYVGLGKLLSSYRQRGRMIEA